MNILGLTITGSLLVIVIVAIICDTNKIKRKFKKDVEELKVGNRYQMKGSPFRFLRGDNPFKTTPNFIVEIVDVKFNRRNVLYVQYKQIVPEYKGKPFSESFKDFIECFDLIK